jgi:hypothetical protein
MKKTKLITIICTLAMAVGLFVLPAVPVSAINVVSSSCDIDPTSAICKGADESVQPFIQTVLNVLIFVIGIIAVIMIIIGAFRYSLSAGEAKAITDAKNTILYAVVGLAVAFSSYAIIAWIVPFFSK